MVARPLSLGGHDGHRALAHCKQHRIDERKKENTMRKVIVSEYVTLDGVMEDPGGAEGFKYGGVASVVVGVEGQPYRNMQDFAAVVQLHWCRRKHGVAR